ncbi:MAG: non-canonical purine NTP pyrophosphatase [Paracoccaceae bacterium]|nr:non-canonical purine NTP pyrophosphatase [Paracoccaceae bacterium]
MTEPAIVLASHNRGKLEELRALLEPFDKRVIAASEYGLTEPAETETSFAGNARIKANHVARQTGLPALSDDSGIEVDALAGAPGIHTADWAETPTGRDFVQAMTRTWRMLEDRSVPEPRTARFRCAICIAWPDGIDTVFEGEVAGRLVWPIRGGHGFGFDPMFRPDGEVMTFGEMPPERKQLLSHRTRAFERFSAGCLGDAP